MIRRWMTVLCLALILWLCSSCADYLAFEDRFDAGETLTPDQLEEISEQIFSGDNDASSETVPGMVYWLKNGEVYHTDRGCRHLDRKTDVLMGTPEEAVAAGRIKACAVCTPETESDVLTDTTTDRETEEISSYSETITETSLEILVVYWTERGKAYHADRDCHYIADSKQVHEGTADEAAQAGKEKPCSSCFD